jgi:hypothetical protein
MTKKFKSRKILSLVLSSAMILSSVPVSWAETSTGEEIYNVLYGKFGTLLNSSDAVDAYSILEELDGASIKNETEDWLNSNESVAGVLKTYGLDSEKIDSMISAIRAEFDTKAGNLFFELFLDDDASYSEYAPQFKAFMLRMYGELPVQVADEIQKYGATGQGKNQENYGKPSTAAAVSGS